MVDSRSIEQRAEDRKRAEQDRQLVEQQKAVAARQAEAEAASLKHQAQIKYAEAMKIHEENKRLELELKTAIAKEEYVYQKNKRERLDRLSDDNWIETQRHHRAMEMGRLKREIADIEANARAAEGQASADEIRALRDILDRL